MLTKGFLKPELSIEILGKRQFLTGIILGILMAFILSYLFNYSRESLRMLTFMADPYILTEKEFRLYKGLTMLVVDSTELEKSLFSIIIYFKHLVNQVTSSLKFLFNRIQFVLY